MARQSRQAIANIPYHIIHRGNNHQTIFFSKNDYQSFIYLLRLAKEKYPCKIYSFILMTNHIHLLLEPVHNEQNLARFMKHVTQRYAQYVNKRHQRTGTLWEGRFKSSAISTDHHLLACSRYIEMNAVRAGIVKLPEQYDFSSYKAKVGLKRFDFLDYDPVYLSLGETESERQKKYQKWFLESISGDELDMIREAIRRNWPYGNEKFQERIESELGRKFEIKKAGRKPKM
ncbi:MAG: transposase [Deltaproteobacteria bacterium]|nr:transposase [Deltaproteobacteria bacterium]MBM4322192.1 transposase [Deltaproteobacteria bacterium]